MKLKKGKWKDFYFGTDLKYIHCYRYLEYIPDVMTRYIIYSVKELLKYNSRYSIREKRTRIGIVGVHNYDR